MKASLLIHELSHGATYAQKSASGKAIVWRTQIGGLAERPSDYRGDKLHELSVTISGPVMSFVQHAHRWPRDFAEVRRVGRMLAHSKHDLESVENEDPDDLEAAMVDAILGCQTALTFAQTFPDSFGDGASMLATVGDGVAFNLDDGSLTPLRELSVSISDYDLPAQTIDELVAIAGVRH